MRHILAIINPISGTRSKDGMEQALKDHLGNNVEVVYTSAPGHATELSRQAVAAGRVDTIVAIGGDGTINETASALIGSPLKLGIIPCGSGNGLARHLHIPLNRDKAISLIKEGRPQRCDTVTVNSRPCFCTMGLGFDASVSQAFARAPRRGLLTYARIAMEQFLKYKPIKYTLTTDSGEFTVSAFLIAVCNASQYGNNAYIAPRASLTDGLLDITILTEGRHAALAMAGLRLFTKGIEHSPLIHTMRSRHVSLRRDLPGAGHIDGEALELPERVDVDIVPSSLSIITPHDQI